MERYITLTNGTSMGDEVIIFKTNCLNGKEKIKKMTAINIEWNTDGAGVDLPTEIEIPDGMTDEEEISDYLSNETGFCHYGFELVE